MEVSRTTGASENIPGTLTEATMAAGITTGRIISMGGQTVFTTSTPTTTTRTAGSTPTIQRRRTRRRRTGITAPVTARTTPTWRAAQRLGCRCQLPDLRNEAGTCGPAASLGDAAADSRPPFFTTTQ